MESSQATIRPRTQKRPSSRPARTAWQQPVNIACESSKLRDRRSPWAQPMFGTSDMSSAYRQIPNPPDEAAAMIVAYCDMEANALRYAILKAHLYSLASAVMNFNRTPCFLTALTRRVAAACTANYFDDSGVMDFIAARGSAQSFLWQAYTMLGLMLDADKDDVASQRHVLGLLLDLTRVISHDSMRVQTPSWTTSTASSPATTVRLQRLPNSGPAGVGLMCHVWQMRPRWADRPYPAPVPRLGP